MPTMNDIHIPKMREATKDDVVVRHPENYHFDPEEYLVNILGRAVANKQDISVTLPSGEGLAIFPARGDYFSFIDDMEAFCLSNINQFEVKVLNPSEVEKFRVSDRQGRNFDELLWQASYYASQGRLIKGCQREDVIEISYWPNLTRLPCHPSAIAITALLTRYPTSITLACRILNVPQEEMFAFYSAAFSAGYVEVQNRQTEPPALKPHRDNSMLGQLLSRISRL